MTNAKPFQGTNVFMSRSLVPPEIFDMLHDVLKQNGAQVFLCCDPSRNGPHDCHVISSSDHEKFEDLRAKGCRLVGPQCVVSCAKERRSLPEQAYTCCLAMDGVRVLASGFEMDEKAEIEKLVNSMGGILQTKTSLDVSFVVVKNVLAAKYKWALNILKKPIVSISWLSQCRGEHRIVPQDSYRVLPFSGLTICVTGILADERKEMQMHIMQNGGKYSAELTKKCTHLIAEAPEGDKYKVARRWGHINIVNRKWFEQSIARKACLNEESYPVQDVSTAATRTMSGCSARQHSQDKGVRNSQSAFSLVVGDSNLSSAAAAENVDPDLEATLSQNMSSMFSNPQVFAREEDSKVPTTQPSNETNHDARVPDDSQTEDDENDLYLSECRLSFIGFETSELRRLVDMVRNGGGSRYVSLNERLTHIVVGSPSELEKKEVRGLAALGIISVVRPSWLEDCDREKKEIPVLQKHMAYDLLLPKGSQSSNKGPAVGTHGLNPNRSTTVDPTIPSNQLVRNADSEFTISREMKAEKPTVDNDREGNLEDKSKSLQPVSDIAAKDDQKVQKIKGKKPSLVFKGRKFCFSEDFPEDRRDEIIEWINQGGGDIVDDPVLHNVHFTIECHGVNPRPFSQSTYISSHWIKSCLEDGCLLDVGGHILYSPLPCPVPFPGFKSFRFCVSQYEEKDRLLLRNLCYTLGAKFVEKLTKKVTHLLCKFRSGPKFEAACKWGIQPITSEWIYECIRQNKLVALEAFCPREISAQEARFCTMTQFPPQPSQIPSQSQEWRSTVDQNHSNGNATDREDMRGSISNKKARLSENNGLNGPFSIGAQAISRIGVSGGKMLKENGDAIEVVPDVAAAIEDLLEQTSKINDKDSPERTSCARNLFPSNRSSSFAQERPESHMVVGLSKHWMSRAQKNDDKGSPCGDGSASAYDRFSETQTESQVVGYEEDLSGRQMIIDRVRTQK